MQAATASKATGADWTNEFDWKPDAVGAERLELSTSASRTLRATKLRYAPKMYREADRV